MGNGIRDDVRHSPALTVLQTILTLGLMVAVSIAGWAFSNWATAVRDASAAIQQRMDRDHTRFETKLNGLDAEHHQHVESTVDRLGRIEAQLDTHTHD